MKTLRVTTGAESYWISLNFKEREFGGRCIRRKNPEGTVSLVLKEAGMVSLSPHFPLSQHQSWNYLCFLAEFTVFE